jgi:hypothetical protein
LWRECIPVRRPFKANVGERFAAGPDFFVLRFFNPRQSAVSSFKNHLVTADKSCGAALETGRCADMAWEG